MAVVQTYGISQLVSTSLRNDLANPPVGFPRPYDANKSSRHIELEEFRPPSWEAIRRNRRHRSCVANAQFHPHRYWASVPVGGNFHPFYPCGSKKRNRNIL